MHHRYAIIFNKMTEKTRTLTAGGFEKALVKIKADIVANDPDFRFPKNFVSKNFELVSADNPDIPLYFKSRFRKDGYETKVKASFAAKPGFAKEDHLYERTPRKTESLEDAVKAGKKILFSLNFDSTYQMMNFRKMRGTDATKVEKWWGDNRGNYKTVSVKSTKVLIESLEDIFNFCAKDKADFKARVFALYQGAVMPYDKFYLGARLPEFKTLFNDIHSLKQSVSMPEGTRYIGFPRLIKFEPTKSFRDNSTILKPRGNLYFTNDEKDACQSFLTFPQKDIAETEDYKEAVEAMLNRQNNFYVLGAPRVQAPHPGRSGNGMKWDILLWNVSDIEQQTHVQLKRKYRDNPVSYPPEEPSFN